MAAPRSRNPLFNRVPNYERVNTVNMWYGTKPLPAGMLGQPGAAQNPLRRPADSGVPGAGYDQAAEAAAVLQRMAENPISAAMAPVQPASPKQLISPGNPMAPPVTQGPDLNMNFTGGMGAGMATRIAGLAPGLAGMVSQGMLAGVGNGLAASKRSPLSFLPSSGMQQALPGEANAANRLNMIEGMPRITSSSQAGMVAGSNPMSSANAALTNGYSPLPSITEGQAYAQGLPMDRAGQSRRIANQNPMFSGMQSRFGEGGALAPTGDYAQSGGTGWYDRLSTQEKYGYGPTTPGVDGRISSDPRYATGMLPKDKDRPARGTPEDRTYLARKYAEQEKRQQDYRDQHGGMSSRQVRRQEQKDRSEAFRFRKAVEGGLNPMSDKAQARFPGATARFKSGDNPMADKPITSSSVKTTESLSQAERAASMVTIGSPEIGATPTRFGAAVVESGYDPANPDMGIPNLHVFDQAASGTRLSPEDIRTLRVLAVNSREKAKGKKDGLFTKADPFYGIATGPYAKNEDYQKEIAKQYTALADMPEDAPDEAFAAWGENMYSTVQRYSKFP